MKIELRKTPGGRAGARDIVVDGVAWGRTIPEGHGCWGKSYEFYQEGGSRIYDGRSPTRVATEKKPPSYMETALAEWKPTEERVLEKARELVESGKLRHPDAVRADKQKAEEDFKRLEADAEAKRKAALLARGYETISPIMDRLTLAQAQHLVERIVLAMEWAQSQ
jgi:hypothetical protein